MERMTVYMEVDFDDLRPLCTLCGEPFSRHFQPPPDSELKAAWCPSGAGYCSRVYTRSLVKRL